MFKSWPVRILFAVATLAAAVVVTVFMRRASIDCPIITYGPGLVIAAIGLLAARKTPY